MKIDYNLSLTPDLILSKISQEQIFDRYLGFSSCNSLVTNPMRDDKKPTCNFYYNSYGKLIFNDFAWKSFGCFDVVQQIYGINFPKALNKVAKDFNIIDKLNLDLKPNIISTTRRIKESKEINIKIKDWGVKGLDYWKQYYFNKDLLEYFNIYEISHYWINNEIYKVKDLAFAYCFKNNKYKILFPYSDFKWLSNTNSEVIQGLDQLQQSNFLIITKALKDVVAFRLFGISAIAPSAESIILNQSQISQLKFKKIFINGDYDYQGVKFMNKHKRLYKAIPIYFNNDYEQKDFADYLKDYGIEETKKLIEKYKKVLL